MEKNSNHPHFIFCGNKKYCFKVLELWQHIHNVSYMGIVVVVKKKIKTPQNATSFVPTILYGEGLPTSL
jgi:hypothetical protein